MFENWTKERLFRIGRIVGLVVLVGVGLWKTGLWKTSDGPARGRVAVVRRCQRVMGTSCTLAAVVPARRQAEARAVLGEVESAIRAIEGRMSSWLDASEISRLNAASMGRKVPLSPAVLTVLGVARDAAEATDGAFDVTCRPLIELWREAGQRGALPDATQRKTARALSGWKLITLLPDGVVKQSDTARVDLGGIAKGYAIDRAIDVLRRAELGGVLTGGLVDIGGDLACFGTPAEGRFWSVDLQDPFATEPLATLQLREGAVCTSGNYERFTEIDGRRYSHILDPRTGLPADAVPSVTVVAETAMVADVWATALSVLGPDGLRRLPVGVEALMVTGTRQEERIVATPGLRKLLKRPLPKRLERLVVVGG
ncbi:MAG: FAD:protein FMN transferase [Thermoguttaceae bacterium]